jgi:NAD(P)-dependent dehydrogenase (short-subunit alcohol dehydrogenase family)
MAKGFFDKLANIEGRTAVLVGGGGGVGRGVALALAEAGVNLAICDNDGAEMTATVEEAGQLGVRVVSSEIDATATEQLAGFFDLVEQEYPEGIDILVNIVGGVKRAMFADTTHWNPRAGRSS